MSLYNVIIDIILQKNCQIQPATTDKQGLATSPSDGITWLSTILMIYYIDL